MKKAAPLPVEALARRCDVAALPFQTTDELPDFTEILGQSRALEALQYGLSGRRAGYNLFALGPSGIGKHSAVMRLLEQRAAAGQAPPDLCYVANFEEPSRPRLLRMPAGRGLQLRQDMLQLVEELVGLIPAALDSEEFKARVRQIEQTFDQQQEQAIKQLREKANAQHVKLYEQPGEFTFAPLRDGQVLDLNMFAALPDAEKQAIETKIAALQSELANILDQQIPELQKQRRDALRALHRDATRAVVQQTLASLRAKYADLPAVSVYLDSVEQEVIHNTRDFLQNEDTAASTGGNHGAYRSYRVNLLVDNSATRGAPVVFEDNPTHAALIGRIEYQAQYGALVTDFNLIRAGALHRANGGYLIIDARKLLTQPFAWESLKRALNAQELRIESLGQSYSLVSTVTLEPEPLSLDVKIVLEADRTLYYLLQSLDPEFAELFKIAADFDDEIERSDETVAAYAQLIATLVRRENLRAFDRTAVAAIIDHSARLTEDTQKLSTCMRDIVDVLHEADFHAAAAEHVHVQGTDVQAAIGSRIRRADRVREKLHEEVQRGVLNIATEGKVVAQVNGLSVTDVGTFSFGFPMRITATTRLGEGEVIDIEREVDMGGPIHSKGVFILASFLGARYARTFPLSLSASLAFEQSYSGVEGDSASLAELCALLSSLADLPLDQSLAVTGSVDQLGRVQAVGSVNEKIEGFFDVCQERGLNRRYGVILPQTNVQHLMLRADVVEAVSAGRFQVYAVSDVDAAMAILSGQMPGRIRAQGDFPPRSINGRVQRCLAEYANLHMSFSGGAREAAAADKKIHPKAAKKPAKG